MNKQRVNYWSCSKFADWIRGTAKPECATGEDWNKWHKTAKGKSRFRYWMAEEGLDILQDIVNFPLDVYHNVRSYVTNRWVYRTHSLTAHSKHIKPGEWRDVGNRFLPCMFDELVDFVEIESAWHHIVWSSEARAKFGEPSRFKFYSGKWRCPEAGLDYFRWAAELTNSDYVDENDPEYGNPTQQALSAREILKLYDWWVNVYPMRVDPYDASGWSEYCDRMRKEKGEDEEDWTFLPNEKSEEEREESRRILDLLRDIEKKYHEEDTEMLIRLIKVRESLWT